MALFLGPHGCGLVGLLAKSLLPNTPKGCLEGYFWTLIVVILGLQSTDLEPDPETLAPKPQQVPSQMTVSPRPSKGFGPLGQMGPF